MICPLPERERFAVTSREVVLDLAAQILAEIGQRDLAEKVARVPVPVIDGRCNLHGGEDHGTVFLVERRQLQVMPDGDGPVFLRVR